MPACSRSPDIPISEQRLVMRLAAVQMNSGAQVAANLQQLDGLLRQAADAAQSLRCCRKTSRFLVRILRRVLP